MKVFTSILLSLILISCSAKKNDSSSSLIVTTNPPSHHGDDLTTISSNEDDATNEDDSTNEDNENIPTSFFQTNVPSFKTFQKSKDKFNKFIIHLEFLQKPIDLIIDSIELNATTYQQAHAIEDKKVILEIEGVELIELKNFKIQFNKELIGHNLWSIQVFGIKNSNQKLYQAQFLNDVRSKLNGLKGLSFVLNTTTCTQGRKMNAQGVCQYYPFYCSDVAQDPDKSQHCLIKRDDNEIVHCYPVSDSNECQQKVTSVCPDVSRFVQFANQMFWGEISGQMISNRQCQ